MHLPGPLRRTRSKLHRAIRRDDASKIERIFSRENPCSTRQHLKKAIKKAISNSSHSALEVLLKAPNAEKAPDPELPEHPKVPSSLDQDTLTRALHSAAAVPDPRAVSLLLKSGARVRAVHKGEEPLHLVVRSNSKKQTNAQEEATMQAIDILVSAGALNGRFVNEELYPPNFAILQGNIPALTRMLSHSSDSLPRKLKKYWTLDYACLCGSLPAFRELLPLIDRF